MLTIPTSTVSLLQANITSFFSDPGMLAVIVFAAGLPLGFWAIKRLIALLPKGK
jgi:hypothetical protein